PVRIAVMFVICGGVGRTLLDATGTFEGPLSTLAVSVTLPATVPASSEIGFENCAVVAFAGIVKLTFRDPDENSIAGSSVGTSAVEENVIINCPVSSLAWGAARVIVMLGTTCVGFRFAGRVIERAAIGGSTVNVNCWLLVALRASVTLTVKVC